MITLYAHGSPNTQKISIALEELQIPYKVEIIDDWKGEQFSLEFTQVNPNAKVPAIFDSETNLTIYESNAILLYLAEKSGKLFPSDPKRKWEGMQLLFFQAASIGPMFGQRAHFTLFAPEKLDYAIDRYSKEGMRLTDVLETLLRDKEYFLSEYSIVDIAHFGWLWCSTNQGFDIRAFPNLSRWFDRVASRSAVQKGTTVPLPLPDFSSFQKEA